MIQSIINYLLISLIPLLPLPLVRMIARRYVAGESSLEALTTARKLNDDGYSVTLDILGEHSKDTSDSKIITEEYSTLYDSIHKENLDCNLSIKLTHIGLDIDEDLARNNLQSLINKARQTNNFLRIDMENSEVTDQILKLYNECKKDYQAVGTVLQAYLYRSSEDLKMLHTNGSSNVRLCKGIYNEPPEIAIQKRKEINQNYLQLLQYAFENKIYVAIATHDLTLLEKVYRLIRELEIPKSLFEFQVLYGVPMSGWLQKHLQNGYKVRVYVPFGEDWYDYSLRRLKENPNIVGYILKNLLRK